LLPVKNGEGRIAAYEVMTATSSIRTMIRDGRTHSLYHDIQTNADLGMQTLDGNLLSLLKEGQIDWEHAVAKCSNAVEFKRRAEVQGLIPSEASIAAN
jgi:twitching motility protein PilT